MPLPKNVRAAAQKALAPRPPASDTAFKKLLDCARSDGECLLVPPNTHDGYRRVSCDGRMTRAHRLAWSQYHLRDVPVGLCVLHSCDVRCCISRTHLFLGTRLDNIRDMEAKGRRGSTPGELNFKAKLRKDDVRTIRSIYKPGHPTLGRAGLAKRYGLTVSGIKKVVAGYRWKGVK